MSFYSDVIVRDSRFNSIEPVADIELLEPITRAAVQAIIAAAARIGKKITVLETYRSSARQMHLFDQGLTELRDVGVHKFGLACDFRLEVNGEYDPKGDDYVFLRTLAEQNGCISGVDWGEPTVAHTFRDYDHIQRIALVRQPALFRASWYPDDAYRPLPDYRRQTPTPLGAPLITHV
jgi:hypothetical protein